MAATWGRVRARGDLQSQERAKQGRCTGRWPSTELDTKQAEESPHPSLEASAKGGERHLITVGGGRWRGASQRGTPRVRAGCAVAGEPEVGHTQG